MAVGVWCQLLVAIETPYSPRTLHVPHYESILQVGIKVTFLLSENIERSFSCFSSALQEMPLAISYHRIS